jgi:hypothetical protein
MDEDALNKQQQELLKSLGKKSVDLIVKISPLPDVVKEGYKVAREIDKAVTTAEKANSGFELTSTDYSINKIAEVSKFIHNETASLARRDENWWMENSRVNLFDSQETTRALQVLQDKRTLLLDLKEACDGLKTLAKVAMAAANVNFKGLAKLYVPSLVVLDGIVTKESCERFDYSISAIDKVVPMIERMIRQTADMQKSVDRFLTLINSTDQREALKAMKAK